MNKKYFLLFVAFTFFIIIISMSISILSLSNDDKTKDKIKSEIDYIEVKLLGMINSLNNIPFSNTVLLEQNSLYGKNSSNDSENKSNNNQENTSSEQENSKNQQKGSAQTSESDSTTQSSDHTKYNVKNQNILIEQSEEIDWNYIKNTVEELYTTWPVIMIDLHSVDIDNKDVLNFSTNLDSLIIAIEKEDKVNTANLLYELYSYLSKYVEQCFDDTNLINKYFTKNCIIKSYIHVSNDEWDLISSQLSNAKEYFNLIINSVSKDVEQANISKAYILINEMSNIVETKDKKLFYLKYKNLMECLMQL